MSPTTEFPASTSMPQFPAAQENQEANLLEVRQLGAPQEGASPQTFFGNGYRYRHDWGDRNGQHILHLNWGIITRDSLVFVAIGEGAAGGGKFIGNARYTLHNVAPNNGVVSIWVNIEWGSPIRLYVDYFVFNP
ncbi:hypothetical protein [Microcoleus sp. F4-D5]|uniref:hypothetical protein n=1 Tax=Microcoleus sp. F4-D5 TaxID=2818760 RepID=UPI002FCF14C5